MRRNAKKREGTRRNTKKRKGTQRNAKNAEVRCDNLVFFGLILAILTYLYIHYFVAYIRMFPFHQYQSKLDDDSLSLSLSLDQKPFRVKHCLLGHSS